MPNGNRNPVFDYRALRLLVGIIALLALSFITQTFCATIKGKVTDADTGQPLIGVNVLVVHTSLGAATDVNGYYIIKGLVPGKYIVQASYLGYKKQFDTVKIESKDETVELNIKLKDPVVPLESVSSPENEAYHKRLQEINKTRQVLHINIDSLKSSGGFLTAYLSMTNNAEDSFYVFKNYSCFNVIKPVITDSTGKLINRNMVMFDCIGMKICPDTIDMILIKPGQTIKYPVTRLAFYSFKVLPAGKYLIKIKYQFNKPEKINTYWCRGSSVIKALIRGLRGTYISSNEKIYIKNN